MSLFLADTNEIVSNKKHAVPTAVHTKVGHERHYNVRAFSCHPVSWPSG